MGCSRAVLGLFAIGCVAASGQAPGPAAVDVRGDWPGFLARLDPIGEALPVRFNDAAFLGNGLLGGTIYRDGDQRLRWEMGRVAFRSFIHPAEMALITDIDTSGDEKATLAWEALPAIDRENKHPANEANPAPKFEIREGLALCEQQRFAGGTFATAWSGSNNRSLQDMLLQSWGNRINVFPAVPKAWENAVFHDLRAGENDAR